MHGGFPKGVLVWASLGIVWFVIYYGPESDKKNGQAIFMKPNDYIELYRSLCPVQYQLMINVRMIQVHYAHMRTYHFCIYCKT